MNARTYRWNAEGSKECKVCDTRTEESLFHMIVECVCYERKREVLMHEPNVNYENDFLRPRVLMKMEVYVSCLV